MGDERRLGFGVTNGLTFVQGTNGFSTNLTVSGTLGNLDDALATLEYVPASNFYGVDTLTIQAFDLGINGLATPLTNTASISLSLVCATIEHQQPCPLASGGFGRADKCLRGD